MIVPSAECRVPSKNPGLGTDTLLERHLTAGDRGDIHVAQLARDALGVLTGKLRNVRRAEMPGQLFGELRLAGRFGAGQADAKRTSDFFHSIQPITART